MTDEIQKSSDIHAGRVIIVGGMNANTSNATTSNATTSGRELGQRLATFGGRHGASGAGRGPVQNRGRGGGSLRDGKPGRKKQRNQVVKEGRPHLENVKQSFY